MMALTQTQLAGAKCSVPDCAHEHHAELHFHPKCHMNAGLEVMYELRSGELTIRCRRCKALVTRIAVQA
jgi:hypothetical protein